MAQFGSGNTMASQDIPAKSSRGESRRQAFLDAAGEVFLRQGVEAASVNEIVRLAGGSLATLYAQFGSKEGLFLAMAERGSNEFLKPIQEIVAQNEPVAEGLQRMGRLYARAMLTPRAVAYFRILVAEGRNHPHLMQQYIARGPERLRAVIGDYLEERIKVGEIRRIDTDWAASFFLELLRARHHQAAVADPNYAVSDAELALHVARAVDLLVEGMRPR